MIRIGIVGYGNLAKGAECSIMQNEDMELTAVFTRRDPASITLQTPHVGVYHMDDLPQWKDKIDVLLLCGGSATDLPALTPRLANDFNVVDSFDNHGEIGNHFANVHPAAEQSGHIAMISIGWDPGMFSVSRLYATSILPKGQTYTFWGKGVSQGHSDAIRRIDGVADARQYTLPIAKAMNRVRTGDNPELSTRDKHTRDCYVVTKDGADQNAIQQAIVTMPNYFADYDTTVHFISKEEMIRDHSGLPHGGSVIYNGVTGIHEEHSNTIEYRLNLESNPEFTASVLICYARAAMKMYHRGMTGCYTAFDVAPVDLSQTSREDLIKHML